VFIALTELCLVHQFKKIRIAVKKPTLKSHTHLQFAPATTLPKIAKEYVLPTLSTGRKRKPVASRVGKGEFHPQTSHRTVREPLDSYGSCYTVDKV
jgi:hypothetical protein